MSRLLNNFFRGVVLLAPLAFTVYVCVRVFATIDGWLGIPIPGVGFVATVALITLFGFLASSFITRQMLSVVESVLERLPFVRLLYSSTKDLLNAFVGEKRRCWMPEPLAYAGVPNRPKGTMVFDIELVDVHSNPTLPPADLKAPPADAKRTSTGLAYKVLRPGTGTRHPAGRDKVVVHYTGWTTNGKVFDTSITRNEPVTLGLDDVIKGWSEGLQLMVEGERTRFWIPQDIAYKGESGSPRGMLIFDVELVRIQ